MNKKIKSIISVLLVSIICLSSTPFVFANNATDTESESGQINDSDFMSLPDYSVGDIIEFGSYPQTQVTDINLINELNKIDINLIAYKYYVGAGGANSTTDKGYSKDGILGTMQRSDYMWYADVEYDGEKYRAVALEKYRPYSTMETNEDFTNSYQNGNGYNTGTIYWFKYEPLQWRVLDPKSGYIMCNQLIDAQPYCNEAYYVNTYQQACHWVSVPGSKNDLCNKWETSSIRVWLNSDFYATVFSSYERGLIYTENEDNVSLATYEDVWNEDYLFGRSDDDATRELRKAYGTDYAKIQGLACVGNESAAYYLKNSGDTAIRVGAVRNTGYAVNNVLFTSCCSCFYINGIRPVLKMHSNPFSGTIKISSDEQIDWMFQTSGCLLINARDNEMPDFDEGKAPWDCYSYCIKETKVTHAKSIGDYSFSKITNLDNISITPSMYGSFTRIGKHAFDGDNKLSVVKFFGTKNDWYNVNIEGYNDPLYRAFIYCIMESSDGTTTTDIIEGDSSSSTNKKIHYLPNYRINSDHYGFENLCDRISYICFEQVFGPAYGSIIYLAQPKAGEKGLCFGMAATTASFLMHRDKISTFYKQKDDSFINCYTLAEMTSPEETFSTWTKTDLLTYIKLAHLHQFTPNASYQDNRNQGDLQGLWNAVKNSVDNGTMPVIISMHDINDKGEICNCHAVLAIGYAEEEYLDNEGNTAIVHRIYVDDSNRDFKCFNIDESRNNYWSAGFYGSETNSCFSYSIQDVTYEGDRTKPLLYNSTALLIKANNTINATKKIFSLSSSNGYGNEEAECNLYWTEENVSDITITTKENDDVAVSCYSSGIRAKIPANTDVKFNVAEGINNNISYSATKDELSEISFSTVGINNKLIYAKVSGVAIGGEVTASETLTGLKVTGLKSGTITITDSDENIISEKSFSTSDGKVEIIYDNTGVDNELMVQTNDNLSNCSCNCHKSGFVNFFWKIINFLHKIFGMKQYQYCDCGTKHW